MFSYDAVPETPVVLIGNVVFSTVASSRLCARTGLKRAPNLFDEFDDPACCLDASLTGRMSPSNHHCLFVSRVLFSIGAIERFRSEEFSLSDLSLWIVRTRENWRQNFGPDTPVLALAAWLLAPGRASSKRLGCRKTGTLVVCASRTRRSVSRLRGVDHVPCGVFVSKCFQLATHCVATRPDADHFDQRSRASSSSSDVPRRLNRLLRECIHTLRSVVSTAAPEFHSGHPNSKIELWKKPWCPARNHLAQIFRGHNTDATSPRCG